MNPSTGVARTKGVTMDNTADARTVETILRRRSIRDGYLDEPVDPVLLSQVVECGLAAPSSKNARPWRLHVVTTSTLRHQIAECVSTSEGVDSYVPADPRTGHAYAEWSSTVLESADVLRQVPAAIFIENRGVFSGGRATLAAVPSSYVADSLTGYGFECIGIGTVVENMWIAANALGLAASFAGDVVIAESSIQEILGFSGDVMGVLMLGRSDVAPPPARPSPASTQVDNPVVWH